MVRIRVGDVYGFVDADTQEAKAFTTYMVYWTALALIIRNNYGQDANAGLVPEIRSRPGFSKLAARRFSGSNDDLRSHLLNAWNSEMALYLVDADDDRVLIQNQWTNVYAYYATARMGLGWLLVRDSATPTTHRRMLEALAAQTTGSQIFPTPWSLGCRGLTGPQHHGFTAAPGDVSNLSLAADPYDMVWKLLRTTRRKEIGRRIEALKAERGLGRAPNGESLRQDQRLHCTTVFDFLWRSRTRANYGDPSIFYVGSLGTARSGQYLKAIQTVTNATMLLFEALISQRAPKLLTDAGVHYMSRDRSGLSDKLIGERLRALGLLSP